ncbi:MAG: glutathione S-transferase family protein [Pseudomonadales bacterium]
MITLHHLNRSRSRRIIWLLEELAVEYQIKAYQRNAETSLAPAELKQVHPLGKSPVIEEDGKVIAESGAITEYLIEKYAPETLAPARGTEDYIDYLQWLHFAESSAMLPLLLRMFLQRDGAKTERLEEYAQLEAGKVLGFFDESLTGKTYLVGEKLSGADIMMSFIVGVLDQTGAIAAFKNLPAYRAQLKTHAGFVRAEELEQEHEV